MGTVGGGAERILADLAGYLVEAGHEVAVLTFDPPGTNSFYPINKRVERLFLGIGDTSGKTRLVDAIQRVGAMRQVIQQEQPDVVVGFMHSIYVPLALAMLGLGVPLVGSEHIVPEHYRDRGSEYWLILISSLFVTRFTVLSESIRESYHWLVRRKAVAMPNPVFIDANAKPIPHEGKRILSVGRLGSQKDHVTLIKAFGRLADQFPDWDLRIAGEGPLRPDLEREIEGRALGDMVSLPGAIQEIASEYMKADLFVIPSRYESFGLATAEAMGYGLAVIGFEDCPGTNELIQHETNGLLVNSSDRVENLAEAMAQLMGDKAMREALAAQGRKTAGQFLPAKIFAQWLDLLQTVRTERDRVR